MLGQWLISEDNTIFSLKKLLSNSRLELFIEDIFNLFCESEIEY